MADPDFIWLGDMMPASAMTESLRAQASEGWSIYLKPSVLRGNQPKFASLPFALL